MKLLIVDDNRTSGKFMERAFTKAGFETVRALSAYQAMHYIQNEPEMRAAVVDVMMPRMDGFELVDWIRSESSHKDLPIVICTGRRDADTIQASVQRQCKYFIAKPASVRELLRKVALAISEGRAGASAA